MTSGNFDTALARLATLSSAELRAEWTRLYMSAAPAISNDLLIMGLAYKLQEKASRSREVPLARMLRHRKVPAIKPGTRLLRSWNGRDIAVVANDDGFIFEDRTYGSLSAIAREVTGTGWSGPRFFGLTDRG